MSTRKVKCIKLYNNNLLEHLYYKVILMIIELKFKSYKIFHLTISTRLIF